MDTGKKKTLYVTDLDGTLLGADSRISRRSAAILNELARRGVMVPPATARIKSFPAAVVRVPVIIRR